LAHQALYIQIALHNQQHLCRAINTIHFLPPQLTQLQQLWSELELPFRLAAVAAALQAHQNLQVVVVLAAVVVAAEFHISFQDPQSLERIQLEMFQLLSDLVGMVVQQVEVLVHLEVLVVLLVLEHCLHLRAAAVAAHIVLVELQGLVGLEDQLAVLQKQLDIQERMEHKEQLQQ
jgi:hypothetical protein